MSDTESERSDWEDSEPPVNPPVESQKSECVGPSLYDIRSMIQDYEQQGVGKRKVTNRAHKKELVLTAEMLAEVKLSKKQLADIAKRHQKSERSEKQKANAIKAGLSRLERLKARKEAEETLDLRPDKTVPGIRLKYPSPRKKRVATVTKKEVVEPEDNSGAFQAVKPVLEDSEDEEEKEIKKKTDKLKKLDSALNSNPWYAQVLASRGVKF